MSGGDWKRGATEWLRGRQGPDDLAVFCVYAAVLLVLADALASTRWLSWVALALVVYAAFRIQSKDLGARSRENQSFLRALGPARTWVQNPKAAFAELRAYKHARCRNCGQRVRVPRGKGRLRVTCPKCHSKFDVRS